MRNYLLLVLVAVVLLISCTEEVTPDPDPVPPADTLIPPTDTVTPPMDTTMPPKPPLPRPPKDTVL